MSNVNAYYLVKVMDKKWADINLDGEIFMRPLSAFGDLSKRDADSNNVFRGDSAEGMAKSFSSGQESHFFKDILGDDLSKVAGVGQIAECYLQEKIYSLYCLEYNETTSKFTDQCKYPVD